MNEDLSKIIKQSYYYPEYKLADDIWRMIELKKSKSLRAKALTSGLFSLASFVGVVVLFFYVKEQFTSSGLSHYLSLIFSDGSLIVSFWKEYLLTLADSIPFASLGALTFLMFSMLVSVRKTVSFYKSQLIKI